MRDVVTARDHIEEALDGVVTWKRHVDRAPRQFIVQTTLMLVFVALPVVVPWVPWWLAWPWATGHYLAASYWYDLRPATRAAIDRREAAYRAELWREARSHTVIERMRRDEISRDAMRRNPWLKYLLNPNLMAIGATFLYSLGRSILRGKR